MTEKWKCNNEYCDALSFEVKNNEHEIKYCPHCGTSLIERLEEPDIEYDDGTEIYIEIDTDFEGAKMENGR